MRKIMTLVLCLVLICMAGCGNSKNTPEPPAEEKTEAEARVSAVMDAQDEKTPVEPQNEETDDGRNVLVVYFSRTGHTKPLAEYAAEYFDADLFEIEAEIPYTDEDINYNNPDSRTSKEQNDKSVRPELASYADLTGYDIIVLAYPIWWGQAPRIVDTFLENHDLSGRTVIPFCTSGSSDIGSSDDNLHRLANASVNWIDGKGLLQAQTETHCLHGWIRWQSS